MTEFLSNIVIEVIRYIGYPGVFLLMTLESVNVPIPSEVVMPFSGFLALQGAFNFWGVVAAGTLGNVAGSLLSYFLAEWILRLRTRSALVRAVLREDHIEKTTMWFQKYGGFSIFFGRVVPVVRTFISLPAGIGKMGISKFTYLTLLGSLLWSIFLTYVGYLLGSEWDTIGRYFRGADYAIVGVAVVIVVYLFLRKRPQKS